MLLLQAASGASVVGMQAGGVGVRAGLTELADAHRRRLAAQEATYGAGAGSSRMTASEAISAFSAYVGDHGAPALGAADPHAADPRGAYDIHIADAGHAADDPHGDPHAAAPHGDGDGHGSHAPAGDHGGGGHDASDEHGDGHHGPSPIDDEMALLLMLSLILLSVIFEKTKHHLEHSVDEHKHIILQALFGELTVLGFIALITFFLMDSGVFTTLSLKLYADADHLLHLFEKVHFGLFFVMILFLLLIGWLIYVQNTAASEWHHLDKKAGEYLLEQRAKRKEVEKRKRALGSAATAEALADAHGRLTDAERANAGAVPPPNLPPPTDAFLRSKYGEGGPVPVGLGAGAGYVPQVDEAAALDVDDTDDWLLRQKQPRLFAFVQMRQRFVLGLTGAEGRKIKLNDPNDTFDFGAYLTQCSAGITAEIVEVHPVTWILVAASLALVYVCNALLSHLGMCVVLVLCGWASTVTLFLVLRDLRRINRMLAPPPSASLSMIADGDEDAQPAYVGIAIAKGCNKHEALFPFSLREEGPEWFSHIVRTVLLTSAVYVIGLQSVFGAEMLHEGGKGVGYAMLSLSLLSVLVTLALLLPLFPLLVQAQSVGMMKKPKLVDKTFRQQKLDLSLRLLKLLTSMQAQARKLTKLKTRSADGGAGDRVSTEEVHAAQERAMASLLKNPAQLKELKAAFLLFDTSGDGSIEAGELKGLLHSMGQMVSDTEALQLLCARERTPALRRSAARPSAARARRRRRAAFSHARASDSARPRRARARRVEMDADGSGSVSELEFLTVMASEVDEEVHEPASIEKLADDMFAILDTDHSGIITFKEFRSELQKLPTGMTDEEIDELLQEMFGGGGDSKIDKVRGRTDGQTDVARCTRRSARARGRARAPPCALLRAALTHAQCGPCARPRARRRRSTSSCTSSNTTRKSLASDPQSRLRMASAQRRAPSPARAETRAVNLDRRNGSDSHV